MDCEVEKRSHGLKSNTLKPCHTATFCAFSMDEILVFCDTWVINVNHTFFLRSPFVDVHRCPSGVLVYFNLVLSCSIFLVGGELRRLCVFYVVYASLLHKSCTIVCVFARSMCKIEAFQDRSTNVDVCLTDFSRMFHRCLTFTSRTRCTYYV